MKRIDPSEYMVDGWDRQGTPTYKRGSLHNKVGMWIMWTYYVIFACMFGNFLILHYMGAVDL